MLITIIAAVAAFGFGFLVGNRSAKGEGTSVLATVKADVAKVAPVVAKVETEVKKI
jgi:hypothetical protein